MHVLNEILMERPVGSQANEQACDILLRKAARMGYDVQTIPFECKYWEKGTSCLEFSGNEIEIFPGPFSPSFQGARELTIVSDREELQMSNITDKILMLKGELTREPLFPKDFPFYYPEEHKMIIDLLESRKPAAIVAITGKHPMCGLHPFPLFEDGNFTVPSAFMGDFEEVKWPEENEMVRLHISSKTIQASGRQLIITKKGISKGKIVVCAHMDSKYGTPGAIDNAAGVEVLFGIMDQLKDYQGYDIDFVPFNGEEYYGVSGELEYLKYMDHQKIPVKLVINIDGAGHKASKTALSTCHFNEQQQRRLDEAITKSQYIVPGSEWYAGDHAMFAFRGIPCIAATSSNLDEVVLDLTHTPDDVPEHIDEKILMESSVFLAKVMEDFVGFGF